MTRDEEIQDLIEAVNKLSDDACYIASRDWFGQVIVGKPILATAQNDRQQKAFDELLEVGFVHGDVEGGHYGYRSTFRGQRAVNICKAAFEGPSSE